MSSLEDKDQTDYQFDQHFFADLALPELEAVEDKARDGKRLSVFDHAAIRAREALTANVKRKPKTLSSLWDAYAEHKGIDRLSREGKRREGNWKRWIAVSGEHFISSVNSTKVIANIHAALDDYVAERESQVTGNSIKRELADILACLRFGSKKFRFNWHIEPPTVRLSEAKRRAVLSVKEQQRLVRARLAAQGEQVKVAVCVLLLQQGGLMVSEVSRLTVQNVQLTGKVPFVAIVGKTKKEARKRVVPIVFGNEMIRAGIVEVVDWLGRVTETTPSAAIKKFMVSVTGREDLTAHCLRHTWRHNAITAEAPDSVNNDIGGWSGSRTVGVDALRYGSAGLTETRRIKMLFEWNKKIFHFLKDVTEART